jgi:hypothetical protein
LYWLWLERCCETGALRMTPNGDRGAEKIAYSTARY